jgi:hypothetical protein
MNAIDTLNILNSRGVQHYVADGDLRYRAAHGAYTPKLRAAIAANRAEIIQILSDGTRPRRTAVDHQSRCWPTDLAAWVMSLTVDDLPPAPFRLNAWTMVTNATKFLHSLRTASRRQSPRPGGGTAVADAMRLRELLAALTVSINTP